MAKKNQSKGSDNPIVNAYRKVVGWQWFWVVGNLSLAFIIVLLLIFGTKYFLNSGTHHGEHLEVPEFVGMTYEEAKAAAAKVGVEVEIVDSVYAKKGRGLVREQNPVAGAKVKEGRRIRLTVNAKGVKKIAMPNLIGYSTRQAVAELNSRGLMLGKFIYVDDMATNNVLKQKHRKKDIEPGEFVEAESSIDLVVGLNSNNSETIIPDVKGKRAVDAVRELNDYYLNVKNVRYDRSVKTYEDSLKAVVYKQAPDASELPIKMGTEVTIHLRVDKAEE